MDSLAFGGRTRWVIILAENRADFTISGIESESEVNTIRDELEDLEGVMGVEINQKSGKAEILFDFDILSEERIKGTIRDMGYEIK
jgi:copper chaperone CopZ